MPFTAIDSEKSLLWAPCLNISQLSSQQKYHYRENFHIPKNKISEHKPVVSLLQTGVKPNSNITMESDPFHLEWVVSR